MRKVIIDQAEIKKALHADIKPYTIAKKLNIPITVIKDIQNGKDRSYFYRRPVIDRNRFCTCCGFRKKMLDAKYLCYVCFAENSQNVGDNEFRLVM